MTASRRDFLHLAGAAGAAASLQGAVASPAAAAALAGVGRPSTEIESRDDAGRLKVNFACGTYDRMVPLYTREVEAEGIDLNYIPIENPREIFDRMARDQAFDVSEMSSSEYIARFSANRNPFVAIPVFPSKTFRHGFIVVNRKSGIRSAKELEGRRVGVQLYTMTAAIFIRGLLQHEYGVDLAKIHWVQGAYDNAGSHGNPDVMPLLRPVPIEINQSGKSLDQLLVEGSLDAVVGASLPPSLGRNPDIQRLFPNFHEVERDYYRRTKIFPIMHLVVIRKALYQRHPEMAASLYAAFNQAKERALGRMHDTGALRAMLPWMQADLEENDAVFGGDPFAYGIEPNRATLEALVTYMTEHAMIAKPMPIEELFVKV